MLLALVEGTKPGDACHVALTSCHVRHECATVFLRLQVFLDLLCQAHQRHAILPARLARLHGLWTVRPMTADSHDVDVCLRLVSDNLSWLYQLSLRLTLNRSRSHQDPHPDGRPFAPSGATRFCAFPGSLDRSLSASLCIAAAALLCSWSFQCLMC